MIGSDRSHSGSPSRPHRNRCLLAGAFIAAGMTAGGLVGIASASPSVNASPSTVTAGSVLTVTGSCQPDTSGYALSAGFVHTEDYAGVPAVSFSTDTVGNFSLHAKVANSTAPGTYSISVRCGGGLIGTNATYTVIAPKVDTDPPVVAVTPAKPVHAMPHYTG